MIHNYVLDTIMRELSPNAWKVLCWAIRQTYGWVDETSPTGRKECDVISYSQFMEATGIGGRSTLARAIKECLDHGYLTRQQAGTSRGRPIYSYRLNTQHRVLKQDSAPTARVPKQDSYESQNRTLKSPKTGPTKETKETKKGDGVVGRLEQFGIDPAIALQIAETRTCRDIDAYLAYVTGPRGRGLTDRVGFVVRRLLDGAPAPNVELPPIAQESRQRFIEGDYADYIEH
jgi:hypothetical protein